MYKSNIKKSLWKKLGFICDSIYLYMNPPSNFINNSMILQVRLGSTVKLFFYLFLFFTNAGTCRRCRFTVKCSLSLGFK